MKLLTLSTENVRGLADGDHAFGREANATAYPVVLITGRACAGKTSLLEAILALKEATGSYGSPPRPEDLLRAGSQRGRIEGTWLLTPEEQAIAGIHQAKVTSALSLGGPPKTGKASPLAAVFQAYSTSPSAGKFEYFGCNRDLAPKMGLAPDDMPFLRLTRKPEKYAGLDHVLVRIATEDAMAAMSKVNEDGVLLKGDQRDSLAPIRAAVSALWPSIALSHVEIGKEGGSVWFERDDRSRVGFYSLSHAEQQAVLFGVTFHVLGLSHSVVLIDEPELHLHPDEQVRFFKVLSRLGIDNQIIAATSSRELVQSMPSDQVIVLGQRA